MADDTAATKGAGAPAGATTGMLPDRRAGVCGAAAVGGTVVAAGAATGMLADRRSGAWTATAGGGAGAGATGIGGAARGVGGGALGRGTGGRAAAGGTGGVEGACADPPTAGKPMMVRLGRAGLAAGGAAVTPGSGGAGRLAGAGVDADTPGISEGLLPVLGSGAAVGTGRAPGHVGGRLAQAAGPAAELRSMVNSP